jgi:hypothetical protein
MMFRRRKHQAVTAPATDQADDAVDVVARAEQILDNAMMDMLFEAIDLVSELRNDPRLSRSHAEQVDAALVNAFAIVAGIGGAE